MNLIESMYAKITGWDPHSWITPDGKRFRHAWQADNHMDVLDPDGNIDGVEYNPRATGFKPNDRVFCTQEDRSFSFKSGTIEAKRANSEYYIVTFDHDGAMRMILGRYLGAGGDRD